MPPKEQFEEGWAAEEALVDILETPLNAGRQARELPSTNRVLWFVNGIISTLLRCKVYFTFVDHNPRTFKVEVLAIADVDGKLYSAAMRTGNIGHNANRDKVLQEVNLISLGLSKQLGVRIFSGKAQPIPEGAVHMFVDPA